MTTTPDAQQQQQQQQQQPPCLTLTPVWPQAQLLHDRAQVDQLCHVNVGVVRQHVVGGVKVDQRHAPACVRGWVWVVVHACLCVRCTGRSYSSSRSAPRLRRYCATPLQ
jgi:hypothetical protein